jgi:hypothetical protein
MAPTAVAERAEAVADVLSSLRARLTPNERNRFQVEMFEAAQHDDRDALFWTLQSWMLTVAMRDHPDHERQYGEFLQVFGGR